ncbi:hypothetical protein D3C84_787590 [compost metagenome]
MIEARGIFTLNSLPLIDHMPLERSNTQRRTGAAAISAAVIGGSGRSKAGTRLRSCAGGKRSTMIFSTRVPGSLMSLPSRVSSWRILLTR